MSVASHIQHTMHGIHAPLNVNVTEALSSNYSVIPNAAAATSVLPLLTPAAFCATAPSIVQLLCSWLSSILQQFHVYFHLYAASAAIQLFVVTSNIQAIKGNNRKCKSFVCNELLSQCHSR